MESRIIISAKIGAMYEFFKENDVCSVRCFKQIRPGRFEARVRHEELRRRLAGTFTIPQLITALQTAEKRDLPFTGSDGQPKPEEYKTVCVYAQTAATPDSTYVSGWYRGRLFEFTFHHDTGNIIFGARPYINGQYIYCAPLLENEKIELREDWLCKVKDSIEKPEYFGFLAGRDTDKAEDIARQLCKRYNTSLRQGTEGSFVEYEVENGASFYTGYEAQAVAHFTVRCPSQSYFCAVPYDEKVKKGQPTHAWHQISKTQYLYASYLLALKSQRQDGCMIAVPYVSVWDGGVAVETTAIVNTTTGEVTDVVVSDHVDGLDVCEREYIFLNDAEVTVHCDENGFDLWADIANERRDLN